jgi:hypothetical protein
VNKECSTGFTFNTAKHPLSLNRVSPVVFTPTEVALIDFDGLVRTADIFRAAFQEYQHSLSAEHTPVGNCVPTEVMFMLNVVDRFASQDVIGEAEDLLKRKVRLVEPRAVPNRPDPGTPGAMYPSATSPPETIGNTRFGVPDHITTA